MALAVGFSFIQEGNNNQDNISIRIIPQGVKVL